MDILNKSQKCAAVAAAAAHELNNELTVILTGICDAISMLEPTHPARVLLVQSRAAAQRCAWHASDVLNFSSKNGVLPVRESLERLLKDQVTNEPKQRQTTS